MSRYSNGDEAFDLSKMERSLDEINDHTQRLALASTIVTLLAIGWSVVLGILLLVWLVSS